MTIPFVIDNQQHKMVDTDLQSKAKADTGAA
jgi:hypothetical protein